MNRSPWLEQLDAQRPLLVLDHDRKDDVVIVGGGIAGLATAYFLLARSARHVTLLEAKRLAHGATGHNAGQAVDYFERSFGEIADLFGPALAKDGFEMVAGAWALLEQIVSDAKLRVPISRTTGLLGFANTEVLLGFLSDRALMAQEGVALRTLLVADDPKVLAKIPRRYDGLYATLPSAAIRGLLETEDARHVAVQLENKGCMNSALFVEELAGYLLRTYPSRFQIFEQTPAGRIQLEREHAEIAVGERRILARDVVLCTNGFEHLDLCAADDAELESRFHQSVSGVTGFMSGYLEPMDRAPAAVSYLDERFLEDHDYVYLTRRPHEREAHVHHNLVCIGGPVKGLGEFTDFPERFPFPAEAQADIDGFWARHRPQAAPPTPAYRWHGLMGYTPTGVRLVGRDPKHPGLLYNLGCNGIGILPSITGGARIADILAGKRLAPSIFDPDIQEKALRRSKNGKRP